MLVFRIEMNLLDVIDSDKLFTFCVKKKTFTNPPVGRSCFFIASINSTEVEASVTSISELALYEIKVFIASGHVDSFVDPVVKCRKCGNFERADQLMERELKESFEGLSTHDLSEIIKAPEK